MDCFFFGVIVPESFLIGLFIGDLKGEQSNSFMGEFSENFLIGLFIGDLKGEQSNSFMGEVSESFLIGLFIGDLKGELNSFMGEIKDDRRVVHNDLKRGKKYNFSPKILSFFQSQKLHFS